MNNREEKFFSPTLSTIGFIISFITAFSPIFTLEPFKKYFINIDLAYPSSIVSVLVGIIISWLVFSVYKYPQINLGKIDRGKGYLESKFIITPSLLIWILVFASLLLYYFFFQFPKDSPISYQVLQSAIYIVFFDILIFSFATLLSITKMKFDDLEEKEQIPDRIFSTLERNKIIKPGIVIYENDPFYSSGQNEIPLQFIGFTRKITLETIVQEKEHIEVLLSKDGRELVKILNKQKIE